MPTISKPRWARCAGAGPGRRRGALGSAAQSRARRCVARASAARPASARSGHPGTVGFPDPEKHLRGGSHGSTQRRSAMLGAVSTDQGDPHVSRSAGPSPSITTVLALVLLFTFKTPDAPSARLHASTERHVVYDECASAEPDASRHGPGRRGGRARRPPTPSPTTPPPLRHRDRLDRPERLRQRRGADHDRSAARSPTSRRSPCRRTAGTRARSPAIGADPGQRGLQAQSANIDIVSGATYTTRPTPSPSRRRIDQAASAAVASARGLTADASAGGLARPDDQREQRAVAVDRRLPAKVGEEDRRVRESISPRVTRSMSPAIDFPS